MLRPVVTIPIVFVHGLLSGIRSKGQSCDDLVTAAGIDLELLRMPDARVSADQYVRLFQLLTIHLDDEALGFLSHPLKRGSFALMIRSTMNSPTLAVAMRRLAHTFHLLQDDVRLEAVREDALVGWALRFSNSSIGQLTFLHELLLRGLWQSLVWLAGCKLSVARFDFDFPRPAYVGGYGSIFPAPLRFEQQKSAFWFEAEKMQRPVRRNEASLRAFLTNAQTHIVLPPRRDDDKVGARVRNHLLATQPTWPDLAATAEALHLSSSTLQRRLASEGTSFQALKDELRRDIAILRLNTSSTSLVTMAFELGFADAAAFQRAFKSWTGTAPGVYRRGA